MKAAVRRALPLHLGALAAYLLVATIYTFPLVAHLASHVPSPPQDQDVFMFLWNNWWIHHALTDLHTKPYITDFVMAPFAIDLRLATVGFLYGIMAIPVFSLFGSVVVLNLQVLATAALNGYAAFRLTSDLAKDDRIGFLCGLMVAATPAINFHLAMGRPSCAALWPVIFTIHFSRRLLEEPINRNAVCLGLALIAALLADQQAMMFGGIWLVILSTHVAVSGRVVVDRRFLVRTAAVILSALGPAYFLYMKPFLHDAGYTVPSPSEANGYSYPVWMLWTPSLFWRNYGLVLSLGLLATVGLVRRVPGLMIWAIGTVVFIVLSFGPVAMGTEVPLPFALLRKLPGFGQFRTPYRFQIPAAIGIACGLALVLAWARSKLPPRVRRFLLPAVAALVVGDLIVFRAVDGFAMQVPARDPVYEVIARDQRRCLLLEVPVGIRTGTDRIGPGEALTFNQPVHQKRLLSGAISRMPLAALAYYRASPSIMLLAGEVSPPGDLAADLERRMEALNVGYVVVHPAMLGSDRLAAVMKLLAGARGLERLELSRELIVFRRETSESPSIRADERPR